MDVGDTFFFPITHTDYQKMQWLHPKLAAVCGNDFEGSVFARRHLMKVLSDRLLRQFWSELN